MTLQRSTRPGRDEAASEVIGFVLMMGIGAVVVGLSMSTLLTAKDAGDGMTTIAQLGQVAQTTANNAIRVSGAASMAPDATYTIVFALPEGPGGNEYFVELTPQEVTVDSQDLDFSMTEDLLGLDTVEVDGQPLVVTGRVSSHDGMVAIEYRMDPTTGPTIEIKDV